MTDMSPAAVTARLREVGELAAFEASPRRVPMDPPSVSGRLRSLAELSELCRKLGRRATAQPR